MYALVADIWNVELLLKMEAVWYVLSCFVFFCKEACISNIFNKILFTWYRNLEGCVQNCKKLLNIYPVKKISVFGN